MRKPASDQLGGYFGWERASGLPFGLDSVMKIFSKGVLPAATLFKVAGWLHPLWFHLPNEETAQAGK